MTAPDPAAAWEAAVRAGDFAEAWRINDRVLAQGRGVPDDPRLPYHLRFVWNGRAFDRRNVLVRCYHGLGDTLQFARYVPALRRRAAHVTLEAQPELIPLLRSLDGVDRLVPFRLDAPLPASECDIEIMEVPHALRLPPERLPPPYLSAPPASPVQSYERAREGTGGALLVIPAKESQERAAANTIGLCCRGGDWDPGRSIDPAMLAAALPPTAQLVKLQPGPLEIDCVNPGDALDDILHTAALIAATGVVVTVDTMLAHLAGALARPVCLLLKHQSDWRWMDQRADLPWYPSMRLFRQAAPGRWDEPLAALARHLSTVTTAAGR